jgi:hypothetical protein
MLARRPETDVDLPPPLALPSPLTTALHLAKALLVRASVTGAAVLAMSLAEELIDCRELRESLWPADATAEPARGTPA